MPEKASRNARKTTRQRPLPLILLRLGGFLLISLAVIFLNKSLPAAAPTAPAPAPGTCSVPR